MIAFHNNLGEEKLTLLLYLLLKLCIFFFYSKKWIFLNSHTDLISQNIQLEIQSFNSNNIKSCVGQKLRLTLKRLWGLLILWVAAARLNCNRINLITGHLPDYNNHWNQLCHLTHPLDGPNHQFPIKAETWG